MGIIVVADHSHCDRRAVNIVNSYPSRKKRIEVLSNALDKVEQLRGVSYEWRKDEYEEKRFPSDRHVGLIAQEVEAVVPGAVYTDTAGYKSVEYANIVPLLIEATKALKTENDSLRARDQEQTQRLSALEDRLQTLEKSSEYNVTVANLSKR